MNLHDRDITRAAKREGLLQGASEAKIEAAKNLLKMKLLSTEQIAQVAGLPVETVLELQQQLL
jgi:predicted transposase/invertase (TIGR01784 family)